MSKSGDMANIPASVAAPGRGVQNCTNLDDDQRRYVLLDVLPLNTLDRSPRFRRPLDPNAAGVTVDVAPEKIRKPRREEISGVIPPLRSPFDQVEAALYLELARSGAEGKTEGQQVQWMAAQGCRTRRISP
jgi:hypothetical protein